MFKRKRPKLSARELEILIRGYKTQLISARANLRHAKMTQNKVIDFLQGKNQGHGHRAESVRSFMDSATDEINALLKNINEDIGE